MSCTLRQGMHKEHQRQGFGNSTHTPPLLTRGRNLFSDQGVQMDIYFILLLILRYLLSFPWQQGVREDKNCKLRGMTLSIHLSPYLEVMASISFFLFLIEKKNPSLFCPSGKFTESTVFQQELKTWFYLPSPKRSLLIVFKCWQPCETLPSKSGSLYDFY